LAWDIDHGPESHSYTGDPPAFSIPIGSMYGIYTNIGGILMVNVTIYSIHGSYGIWDSPSLSKKQQRSNLRGSTANWSWQAWVNAAVVHVEPRQPYHCKMRQRMWLHRPYDPEKRVSKIKCYYNL
jgi:hypothetical protein